MKEKIICFISSMLAVIVGIVGLKLLGVAEWYPAVIFGVLGIEILIEVFAKNIKENRKNIFNILVDFFGVCTGAGIAALICYYI